MKTLRRPKHLGTFSKGVPGSLTINFGLSGGIHCDASCAHHPDSTTIGADRSCYAVTVENRHDRTQLKGKLARHENLSPSIVLGRCLNELKTAIDKGYRVPWLRISTNGSLPQPGNVSAILKAQLVSLARLCRNNGIPLHIPVETHDKAVFYRAIFGKLATVRESLQVESDQTIVDGAVSFTAGADIQSGRAIRLRRIEAAREAARRRRKATGRKTIVCPAVVGSFIHRHDKERKASLKCGSCTACANPEMDIVYPLH